MVRIFFIVFLLISKSYAWNAIGHQIVAQIAYDHLTPEARILFEGYNNSLNSFYFSSNFITASAWLDQIRRKDIDWFDTLHYIDLPFSNDQTPLPTVQERNALWGIQQAVLALSSPKSSAFDKGVSLRVLVHIVGDVHQPLHAATRISKRLPHGDLGGNLFYLTSNSTRTNLHRYWDNGAGYLVKHNKSFRIKNKALQLEKKWSCTSAQKQKDPKQWIKESHQLAVTQVYTLSTHDLPSKHYQMKAQNLTKKQLVLAGCRLAYVLNEIARV